MKILWKGLGWACKLVGAGSQRITAAGLTTDGDSDIAHTSVSYWVAGGLNKETVVFTRTSFW